MLNNAKHDDVIQWKHFPRYWPFVRGNPKSPVNSPHKGQWRGALVFSLICAWTDSWVNNGDAGDLRRYRAHHDVIVVNILKCKSLHLFHDCFRHACDVLHIKIAHTFPNKLSPYSQQYPSLRLNVLWLVHDLYPRGWLKIYLCDCHFEESNVMHHETDSFEYSSF